MIPWAAKRFSTQKTTCLAVIFFSSMRNGSTVLASEPYEHSENPFGPDSRPKQRIKRSVFSFAFFFLFLMWKRKISITLDCHKRSTCEDSTREEGPKGIRIALL